MYIQSCKPCTVYKEAVKIKDSLPGFELTSVTYKTHSQLYMQNCKPCTVYKEMVKVKGSLPGFTFTNETRPLSLPLNHNFSEIL